MKISLLGSLIATSLIGTKAFVEVKPQPSLPLATSTRSSHQHLAMSINPHDTQSTKHMNRNAFIQSAATLFVSASLVLSASFLPLPSQAAGYNALTDEQKAVAEAWRLVDNSFLDRTFNGQDWFKLRQDLVKRKYKSMDEARAAIDQMTSTLGDKYTRYLPPAKYQSIIDSATGTLAGVGVEIATDKQGHVIASDIEENSPARKAGIQINDVFLEVDGQKFDSQSTPDDVAVRLRGPEGSRVGVVMERDGKVQDFILTREPITITSVRPYSTNVAGVGKVGVIRIKSFSGTTSDKVTDAYNDLKKQGCKAFVFDLRGNPGGLLPGGVNTASLFLEQDKPIVYVASKTGIVDSQAALGTGIDIETPIVILVDSNTASAAEVFTAALKENGRATVVGEQTFGKGVVQTIRGLSDNNGGLAITVARYETPKHNNINKQGIAVDFPTSVSCPKDDASDCLKGVPFNKPEA